MVFHQSVKRSTDYLPDLITEGIGSFGKFLPVEMGNASNEIDGSLRWVDIGIGVDVANEELLETVNQ